MNCKRRLLVCKTLYYSSVGRQLHPTWNHHAFCSLRIPATRAKIPMSWLHRTLLSIFIWNQSKDQGAGSAETTSHPSRYFCLIFILFTSTHITWIKHHTWVYHEPNFPPSFLSKVLRIVIDIHRLSQPTYSPRRTTYSLPRRCWARVQKKKPLALRRFVAICIMQSY